MPWGYQRVTSVLAFVGRSSEAARPVANEPFKAAMVITAATMPRRPVSYRPSHRICMLLIPGGLR